MKMDFMSLFLVSKSQYGYSSVTLGGIVVWTQIYKEDTMNEFYNKHYITVDSQNRITSGWSDGPLRDRDTAGAICINEQGGYQFRLFPGGEENPPLYTMDGIPLYKWDGQQVIARTEAEIAADRAAISEPPPSPQEQLRADVDFLAAMQGVQL